MRITPLTALGLLLGLALSSSAEAVPMNVSGTLTILQPIPVHTVGVEPIVFGQSPDPVQVSVVGGAFSVPSGLFVGAFTPPTPALTGGIGPFVDLASLSVSAGAGSFAPGAGPAGGFGGSQAVGGSLVASVLGGLFDLPISLGVAGIGGVGQTAIGALNVSVTGALWTTGAARVTGVTTSIVRTVGGATGPVAIVGNRQNVTTGFFLVTSTAQFLSVVNTVTLSGNDARTAGGLGSLTLVTPVRVMTNAAGNLPIFAVQTLEFTAVPEPGTSVLLAAGISGVWLGARKRPRPPGRR